VVAGRRCPNCAALSPGGSVAPEQSRPLSIAPMRTTRPATLPPAQTPGWIWTVTKALALSLVLGAVALGYARCGERPGFLSLRTAWHGESVESARTVVFFLHGYGGSIDDVDWLASDLRKAGLPNETAIVFVDGPFSAGLGRSWGDSSEQEGASLERLRSLIQSEIGGVTPPPRVIVAGFSQGAGIAADVAALEPRVGAVAIFAPCRVRHTPALAERQDVEILLVHGATDSICDVSISRQLARALDGPGLRYEEIEGGHAMPPVAIQALAELVAKPAP
jgi:predicted esterase